MTDWQKIDTVTLFIEMRSYVCMCVLGLKVKTSDGVLGWVDLVICREW